MARHHHYHQHHHHHRRRDSSSESDDYSENGMRTSRRRDVSYNDINRDLANLNLRPDVQGLYEGYPADGPLRNHDAAPLAQGYLTQPGYGYSQNLSPTHQRQPSESYLNGRSRPSSPYYKSEEPQGHQRRPSQSPSYRPPAGPPPSWHEPPRESHYRPPPGPPSSRHRQSQDLQYRPPVGPPPSWQRQTDTAWRPPPGPPPSHQLDNAGRHGRSGEDYRREQQRPPENYRRYSPQPPNYPYQQPQQGPSGYVGGPPAQAEHPYTLNDRTLRRKSLLIGINYVGSKNALRGCQQDVTNMREFISYQGYSNDQRSQVIMRDDRYTDPRGKLWPTGRNIIAAMRWLVSEPNTCNFLHYSGHGAQIPDPDTNRDTGYVDTIVPVDFENNGQISSATLHRVLVSGLHPTSTLFVIFDCCHSGSALELPFVYRSDEDGNVNLLDNIETGVELFEEAGRLFEGGFSIDKLAHASELYAGGHTFFRQLSHMGDEEGIGDDDRFAEGWSAEHKFVTMFSGCRDDQTSADATIGGASVGAMSWAFLQTMKRNPYPTYLSTLQETRDILVESNYKQVPQLSLGVREIDLDQPLRF